MSSASRPTWQLVLQAADQLTAAGLAPFKLDQLVELVQRRDPTRSRGSISPVVQGMTVNAGGGPSSAAGKPLFRVRPGYYELISPGPVTVQPPGRTRTLSAVTDQGGQPDQAVTRDGGTRIPAVASEEPLLAPPGDSAVQRAAEATILGIAEGVLEAKLQPRRLMLSDGVRIEVDGVSDEPPILCEVWAHQGATKTAQAHKVLHDALKLFVAGRAMRPHPRLVLILSDSAAARRFQGKSWYAYALVTLGVELLVVDIPGELRDDIVRAQQRQFR